MELKQKIRAWFTDKECLWLMVSQRDAKIETLEARIRNYESQMFTRTNKAIKEIMRLEIELAEANKQIERLSVINEGWIAETDHLKRRVEVWEAAAKLVGINIMIGG